MSNNKAKQLYSPAKLAEKFRTKPGVHIFGQEEWNRTREAMTLGELRKYDDENHRLILKESKEYRFDDFRECAAAKWQAWSFAMKKLGVRVVEDMGRSPEAVRKDPRFFQKRLDNEMHVKGIRCEERPPKHINVEEDLWKSGMYVYYHGDIVYFISNPMQVRAKEGDIYLANRVQFMIVTNAKLE